MTAKKLRGELVSIRQFVGEELSRQSAARQEIEQRPPLWLKFWASRMQCLIGLQLGQYSDRLVDFTLEQLVKWGNWTVSQAVHSGGGGALNLWQWRSSLGRFPTADEWRTWIFWADKDRECWPQDREAKLMRLGVIVNTVRHERTYQVDQVDKDIPEWVQHPWPAYMEKPLSLPNPPWPAESKEPFRIPEGL
jgi:hypothetical protein